ncbi:MAG: ABC transporter ATP-binding protein [Candidatus Cloacimonetes bacterium]|nr:ABC transporter ATP-binding protein [Candidatus Cloacimonadota bacterium]
MQKKESLVDFLRELFVFSSSYIHLYFFAFIFLALSNFFSAKIPNSVQSAIDSTANAGASDKIIWFAGMIIACAGVQFIFRVLARILVYRACREQEHSLRDKLMEKVCSFSIKTLSQKSIGDYVTNMSEDTTQVRIFVGFGFVQLANIIMVYVFCLPYMIAISPKLTMYAIIPYPLLLIYIAVLNHKLYYLNLDMKAKLAQVTDFVSQSVYGIYVIKSFHAMTSFSQKFDAESDELFTKQWRATLYNLILMPGLILISSFGEWIVIYLGVPMINAGEISQGQFIAYHGYISILIFSSVAVGFGVSTFNRGFTSWIRLREIYTLESEPEKSDALVESPNKLEVSRLKFTHYIHDKESFSLDIESLNLDLNKSIGIFGPIGSGKSTFIKLLAGIYQAKEGDFQFDDQLISSKHYADLRKFISYVPQNVFLFSKSIEDNISFFEDFTQDQIKDALTFADLFSDVEKFENGTETIVGERGVRLSLGQKQRLTLARSHFHPKDVLLIDDCFSALDTVTEETILQSLIQSDIYKTLFLCSHRISTLKHCEQILVFDKGEITHKGSHDQLLKTCPYYQEIWSIQQMFEEVSS